MVAAGQMPIFRQAKYSGVCPRRHQQYKSQRTKPKKKTKQVLVNIVLEHLK